MNDFNIDKDKGGISKRFSEFKISEFSSACKFIADLPYKRNQNKDSILCVFDDNGGTCSTKHAILRKLALENNKENVKLILGIFKMDAEYAPSIKNTLNKFQLKYIPEAHNYLKIDNQYFDFTKPNSSYKNFESKILFETEIEYNQISSEKIFLHKKYLEEWLVEKGIKYTLDEVWEIREKCIKDLQKQDAKQIKTNSSEEDFNCNSSPVCFQNSPEVRDEYKQ